MALLLTESVTFFFAASVSYPRIVAAIRTFFGSVTEPGAETLSTVQFGDLPLETRCGISVALSGNCRSAKPEGISAFWKSLAKWTSIGVFTEEARVRKYRTRSP